jgi:hypothetical protein
LTILAQKISLKKSLEVKNQRRDKNTLGEDSAYFSSQEKSIYLVWMPLGNFADIKEKLSVI